MEDQDDSQTRLRVGLTILAGVYDKQCVLHRLRGTPHLVKQIFELATNEIRWKCHIKLANDDIDRQRLQLVREARRQSELPNDDDSFLFFTEVFDKEEYDEPLEFPDPSDININMMPFILKSRFEDCQLPDYLKPYWPLIHYCSSRESEKYHGSWFSKKESEYGKVCYLTIQEGQVEAGTSQRRPGLHTDCPGKVKIKGSGVSGEARWVDPLASVERPGPQGGPGGPLRREKKRRKEKRQKVESRTKGSGCSHRYLSHPWGFGGAHLVPARDEDKEERYSYRWSHETRMVLLGGIYMASTIDDSCSVHNCKIVPNARGDEVIGRLGNVEHLRPLLPEPVLTKANRMYWLTDRTPHESLPLKETEYRQFFRLVTSQVGLWYEDHSTKNPRGVMPDPKITMIVKGSKFDKAGVVVV